MRFPLAIAVLLWAVSTASAQSPQQAAPNASLPFSAWAQSHIHPAVARIVVPGEGSISYGSGTLVYADQQLGIVVTNWHVINEAAGPISVHFPDGFYSLGTVRNADRDWDLALIVIRKPNAAPVSLADRAPRPGEMLTIAGYGSGKYRAASGPCTQYVAPGLKFPYEMVELAASARQGDSGGPIFNDRGELAGVLFGEGQGRTSGSYCGRVRWFLSSIVPTVNNPVTQVAASDEAPGSAKPIGIGQVAASRPPTTETTRPRGFAPSPAQTQAIETSEAERPAVVASTRAGEPAVATVRQIGWRDVAGDTLGQQAKTVLAAIGVLAIVLQVLRFVSREPATEAAE